MLLTIVGIIVLLLPFLPAVFSQSVKENCLKTVVFVLSAHLFIAVVFQTLKIFNYLNVALASIALSVFWTFFIGKDQRKNLKINLVPILFFITLIIGSVYFLNTVHGGYNGLYSVIHTQEYQEAHELSYPYPYFSDEWYAVALIESSIENNFLPSLNPFSKNASFPNLELAFHSLISELSLLLNLNPLTGFVALSVAMNVVLLCVLFLLAYIFTEQWPAAFFTAFSALFITSGANLPGIWNLIPMTLGVIILLVSLYFTAKKCFPWAAWAGFISLIFYPPLVVFWLPSVIFQFIWKKRKEDGLLENLFLILFVVLSASVIIGLFYYLGVETKYLFLFLMEYVSVFLFVLILVFNGNKIKNYFGRKFALAILLVLPLAYYLFGMIINLNGISHYFNFVFQKLFYQSFIPDFIPQYPIYAVVPLIVLVFFVIGFGRLYKNHKGYLLSVGVGLLFWFFYSLTTFRIIIDYQRVVFVTAVLVTIGASCGIAVILNYAKNFEIFSKNEKLYNYSLLLVAVLIIIVSSFGYTERDNWQKLVLVSKDGDRTAMPVAPANTFLHPDDLRIFENLGPARFMSLDWKGTVIGVATDAMPIVTKPGTISMNVGLLPVFAKANCQEKIEILKKHEADYLYWPPLNCPGLVEEDESAEGLVLYKVTAPEN